MAAVATDTALHFLFEAKPLWTGQIAAGGVADGSTTTIPLQAASDLDSGDVYVIRINRVNSSGTKTTNPSANTEVAYGKLSGTNLINCVRGAEGTAQLWEAGTVVEILFTSTHWNKMIEFLGVEHQADGTHSKTGEDALLVSGTAGTTNNLAKWNADGDLVDGFGVIDDDTLATASATTIPTSESVKAYVDDNAGAGGKYVFIIPGTAAAGTDVAGTWFTPGAGTITSIDLFADAAGDTGSTIVDVNLDGTTVFTTQGNRPTLATTATVDTGNVPDVTAFTASQKVTVDIDQITTTPQTDLYVVIKYTE